MVDTGSPQKSAPLFEPQSGKYFGSDKEFSFKTTGDIREWASAELEFWTFLRNDKLQITRQLLALMQEQVEQIRSFQNDCDILENPEAQPNEQQRSYNTA